MFAQNTEGVNGSIVDAESGKGIAYVTVIAENSKGKQTGSAISDNDGGFFLPLKGKGQYKIHFSQIGYASVTKEIGYGGGVVNLPETALTNRVIEVELTNMPLIRQEADRIVYDVGSDPDAARMKISEIMKKIPDLNINPGNGSLVYNNVPIEKILFDEHEEGMISAERQYPMDFIKANVMSQIEVILPGSAEYNNDKPVINIKLAKKLPNGIAWEISPSAGTRGNYRAGIDAVTKVDAIGIGINYTAGMSKPPALLTNIESYNLTDGSHTLNISESRRKQYNHNVKLNVFRSFHDNKIKVDLSARTSFNESDSRLSSNSKTTDANGATSDSHESSSRTMMKSPPRFNVSGSFRHNIDKSSSYSIVYDFSDSRSDQSSRTETIYSAYDDNQRSESSTGVRQHVVNIIYFYRTAAENKKFSPRFYAHVNYINRDYYNSTEYYRYDYLNDNYIVDQERYGGLNYRQNMVNGRFAYSDRLFNRMLSYRLDLNVEGVSNKGVFLSTGSTRLDYTEFNFFPRFTLNYRIKSFSLNGSYATNVKRPAMEQLNPYVDDTNPNHILVGNPGLKGEYSHNFNIGLRKSFKTRWLSDLSIAYKYGFTNNAITRLTSMTPDNISVTSYANIAKNTAEGISLGMSHMPADMLLIINSFGYSKRIYELPDKSSNTTKSFSVSSMATIFIKKVPCINIAYSYMPAYTSAQNKKNSYYSALDASIGWYFSKIHLGGSLSCNDVLNGNKKVRETTGGDTFIQYADRQRIGRSFKVSLYWRFGRFKDPDRPEKINVDVYDMDVSQ